MSQQVPMSLPHSPHVTLIAEVASNAGRNRRLAEYFIDAFAAAGADVIKFQLTRFARLTRTDSQYEWFQGADWSPDDIRGLNASCHDRGVRPLWTVYHPDDVPLVRDHWAVKVGCGEAHDGALAQAVLACPFEALFVSEGILPASAAYAHDSRVKLLGVCPHYPAPLGMVALRFAKGQYHGWSDHSIGLDESHLAVLLGATVIERHVQVSQQARPPAPWELTPSAFAELRRRVDARPDRFLGRWNHLGERGEEKDDGA